MKKILFNQQGQTLVILLTYMVIAIIVTTASIALVLNSSRGTDKVYQGANSLDIAESGAETAMIKLIRDPNYSGEIFPIGRIPMFSPYPIKAAYNKRSGGLSGFIKGL